MSPSEQFSYIWPYKQVYVELARFMDEISLTPNSFILTYVRSGMQLEGSNAREKSWGGGAHLGNFEPKSHTVCIVLDGKRGYLRDD